MKIHHKIGATIVTSAAATGVMLAVPSVADAAFGDSTLSYGMENADVTVLQEILKEKGYFNFHTATGYFGSITRQAVQDFQKDNSLKVDGIVGPKTFALLVQNSESQTKANNETGATQTANQSSTSSTSSSSSSASSATVEQIGTNQLLKVGSRGKEVENLQLFLKKAGFFQHDSATGYYGSITEQAVREYQQVRGLKVDGIAGPQTLAAVNQDISSSTVSTPSSGNSSQSTTVLRSGSQGEEVKTLQSQLKQLGFFNHNITGIYSTITTEAVRNFQKSAGIQVDGIAGPQTFSALEKALANQGTGGSSNSSGSNSNNSSSNNSGSSGSNSSNSSESAATILLKEGSSGTKVTELQSKLKAIGLFKQEPTGYFGPITKEALTQFQSQWGLVADGLVSQATWDKLEEIASIHLKDAENNGSSSGSSFNALNLVADASNYIGVPYSWGGTTPDGFDCSGFVQFVFKNNGVHLPRTVKEQWNATTSVSNLQVGDIVYFETISQGPSHNGIYIGNNQFIHSGSSTGVAIASLSNSYWSQRYLGARRVK
ncbi:Cell wall-associated hydrolase, NlpC family [Evansella caseinilytica]|uniref:Cell wall-associated hydrolase, NlpC family n=1 Tax=Evansella caseinilytica TaxID=1503961 RepID=A0A1H3T7N9_9BACI|nr:peptidoglycan-binding protein [Evansella caseinilytica]SDZ46353.1 Cell wall-associated hydrolase, NlpC family [Evansella caseinilytica]